MPVQGVRGAGPHHPVQCPRWGRMPRGVGPSPGHRAAPEAQAAVPTWGSPPPRPPRLTPLTPPPPDPLVGAGESIGMESNSRQCRCMVIFRPTDRPTDRPSTDRPTDRPTRPTRPTATDRYAPIPPGDCRPQVQEEIFQRGPTPWGPPPPGAGLEIDDPPQVHPHPPRGLPFDSH